MNEQDLTRLLMRAASTLAITAAVLALGFFITAVVRLSPGVFLAGLVLLALSGGAGVVSIHVLGKRAGRSILDSQIEREVLTSKQRRELRKARAGVVMQRAMVEIDQERENITHRELEAAEDPNKPPHKTRFSPDPVHRLRIRD
jgi:hypothetical protein